MGISNLSKTDRKKLFKTFKQYPEFFLNIAKSMEKAKDFFIEDMKKKENWDDYREWWEKKPNDPLDADKYEDVVEERIIDRAIEEFEKEIEKYDFECFELTITGDR